MAWGDGTSAELERKGLSKYPPRLSKPELSASKKPPSADAPCDSTPISKTVILDMGLGSREEGFRLNGCR
jgi:hypothetical protein